MIVRVAAVEKTPPRRRLAHGCAGVAPTKSFSSRAFLFNNRYEIGSACRHCSWASRPSCAQLDRSKSRERQEGCPGRTGMAERRRVLLVVKNPFCAANARI